MAPKEEASAKSSFTANKLHYDGEIVISGISGRFPESDNMREFRDNLMEKVDMVTDDERRWKKDHPDIPQGTGKIKDLSKFDTLFFGVFFKQAHAMDPVCRIMMELAYEAVIDAGVNPRTLRGSNTGAFMVESFSDSEKLWFYEKIQPNGFGLTGCAKTMLANRVSYSLGIVGPSYTIDSACSSSLSAIEQAYRSIRNGQCDAALVGGANLCLHPSVSFQYARLGVLSADGHCKAFDANADGYARSDTVSVVYLQKAKEAKRIYATLVHAKTNCEGFKEQGVAFPSRSVQNGLLKEFYEECKVAPSSLAYLEAYGGGTKTGDTEELNSIDATFCTGRKGPLRIGSVKSNMGHSEPASGMNQIAKVIIAYETDTIPPNLHYKTPCSDAPGLQDGRIRVVTEPTPWNGGYVGISSFGFGGSNAHILLKSNPKEKINGGAPQDDLPRLVVASGRTEEAVETILNDVESQPIDVEYLRLLHEIHADDISGHLYRGYTIVGTSAADKKIREVDHYPGAKRPIWFVFSGMGSQWSGMGADLLRFSVFANAIKQCDHVLKPRGVDIYNIITNTDQAMFDNILHSFVGITAVQIGLTDLVTSLGIVPDALIGHSLGEVGCAYADGSFTLEQAILAAYYRGVVSLEVKTVDGLMAAVGLGYNDIKDLCPPEIEVACHNGPESTTLSGPAQSMKAFIAELTEKKIFVREVNSNHIPYHSKYIRETGPKYIEYMKKVVPNPKLRSDKWFCTSVPKSQWDSPLAKYSSAEYHANNVLSPVLFEETSALIPKDAICIEIAPHALLQAILKRSLPSGVVNVALTQRGHKANAEVFLQGIGKLYKVGLQPAVWKLYPEVSFPVSRGTPMIAPLIRWDHSQQWYVMTYDKKEIITHGEKTIKLSLSDEHYKYMRNHVIGGKNLLPAAGYLVLIWELFGKMREENYTEMPVTFEEIKFLKNLTIPSDDALEITLMIQKGTGSFEVTENEQVVAMGYIRCAQNPEQEQIKFRTPGDNEIEDLNHEDVYRELELRGYQYSEQFKSIKSATGNGSKGTIRWSDNWVAFIDNMLQMKILGTDTRNLILPTSIQKLNINTREHLELMSESSKEIKAFKVYTSKVHDVIQSGGIQIRGFKANAVIDQCKSENSSSSELRPVFHAWLDQSLNGDLASFQWTEGPITSDCRDPQLVRVVYSSLNFKDIMLASGKLTADIFGPTKRLRESVLGYEFAGITKTGRRIMGLVESRALTNLVICDPDYAWTVPESWTLEQAATVPYVYATCYYALFECGKMRKGHKVLIHSGSSAVGQAAIALALWTGCEVFTTVGSDEKRQFIKQRFPMIHDDHIGDSRKTTFEQMIIKQTNAKGVDIVLNSLTNKLQASLMCMADRGKFVEIGNTDMINDNTLGLAIFLKEISFHGVVMDKVLHTSVAKHIGLHKMIQKGLDEGAIKPITFTTFPREQIEFAFKYMDAGKHIGKVIIKIQNENNLGISIPALRRFYCKEDRSYVIIRDLEDFGLELADWLVLRGARYLILTSYSGVSNGYQRMRINLWQSYGVNVTVISAKEASRLKDCEEILLTSSKQAPVDAVFLFPDVSEDSQTMNSRSVKNLHQVSKSWCSKLRHFVVFSSTARSHDNTEQIFNTVMESVCVKRTSDGLPALAVYWGKVANHDSQRDENGENGSLQRRTAFFLDQLNGFLSQKSSAVVTMN